MPRLRTLCVALGLCFGATAALAGPACDEEGAQVFVLAVAPAVGASTDAVVYRFDNGEWLVPMAALGYHAAAITVTCEIEGVEHARLAVADIASYDEQQQRLNISRTLRRTTAQTLTADQAVPAYSAVEPGLRSVVDFALLKSDERLHAGAFVENSFRTQDWLLYSSANAGNLGAAINDVSLLDTFVRTEDVANRRFLQIGDTAYLSDLTQRALRMTGISFGRGITVNPWYLPYSYGTVNASAIVPSTMEVYVNQQRLQKQSVDAGPFSLVDMAGPVGYGEYKVITRDAVGREQVTTQPFYHSTEIIARGFLEYRVDIGRTRENYGTANYDLGRATQIGYLRYGVTDDLTIGAQATHSSQAASAGIKPAYRFGTLGVIDGIFQLDRAGRRLWSIAGEHSTSRFTVRGEYGRAEEGYRDVLANDSGPMPLRRLGLNASYRFTRGSVSLSRQAFENAHGRTMTNVIGGQYSVNHKLTLIATATAIRDSSHSERSLFAGAVISFGKRTTSMATATRTPDGTSYQTSLSRSPGAATGFGYEVLAANRDSSPYAQTRGIWNADLFRGEFDANTNGNAQLRIKTGSVLTPHAFFTARPTADAFVLIDTNGIGGVEVSGPSERRVTTNEDGYALFPGLSADVRQKLAVSIDKLPLDVGIISEQQTVTPPRLGIVKAKFDLVRIDPVLTYLTDTSGQPLPRGAVATIAGQRPHVIGSEGALYLESAHGVKQIEVQTSQSICTFTPTTPLADQQILKASQCS